MLFEYFQNRIFGEEGYFQKFLGCTLPLHNLKASILNPGIIFLCVSWHAYNTALIWKTRYLCGDAIIYLNCIFVISLLLEMNILVMVIILVCPACMPERNPGKSLPWVGVSLSPVSVGTVMSGMA